MNVWWMQLIKIKAIKKKRISYVITVLNANRTWPLHIGITNYCLCCTVQFLLLKSTHYLSNFPSMNVLLIPHHAIQKACCLSSWGLSERFSRHQLRGAYHTAVLAVIPGQLSKRRENFVRWECEFKWNCCLQLWWWCSLIWVTIMNVFCSDKEMWSQKDIFYFIDVYSWSKLEIQLMFFWGQRQGKYKELVRFLIWINFAKGLLKCAWQLSWELRNLLSKERWCVLPNMRCACPKSGNGNLKLRWSRLRGMTKRDLTFHAFSCQIMDLDIYNRCYVEWPLTSPFRKIYDIFLFSEFIKFFFSLTVVVRVPQSCPPLNKSVSVAVNGCVTSVCKQNVGNSSRQLVMFLFSRVWSTLFGNGSIIPSTGNGNCVWRQLLKVGCISKKRSCVLKTSVFKVYSLSFWNASFFFKKTMIKRIMVRYWYYYYWEDVDI